MNLEQLLALLSDNSEAKAFITALSEKATNADGLIDRINTLEGKNSEILGSRKNQDAKYKSMLKLLGVEELTEEAVEAFKSSKGTDASKAEIENLKGLIEKANGEKDTLTKDFDAKFQKMALKNAIANAGLGANVANEAMYGIVSNLVREGAVFENDTIVYKKDDTTIYGADNKPLTLDGKIDMLKADPNYAGLFNVDTAGGTGTPTGTGDGEHVATGDMSPSEMMKSGRK